MILLSFSCATPTPAPASQPELVFEGDGYRVERDHWGADFEAIRVRMPRTARLGVTPSENVRDFAALIPHDGGPWVAVNGGFYDADRAMGLVVDGGVEYSPVTAYGGSGIIADPGGLIRVLHRPVWTSQMADHALQSIDRLVVAGTSVVNDREGAPRAARTAIAVSDDAVWTVVTWSASSVASRDGSSVTLAGTSGAGPTLAELASYLRDQLEAVEALNLDGAVSTQLAFRDGDKRLEVRGERGTINAVVLRTR